MNKIDELLERLESQGHLTQGDGLLALLDTGKEAAATIRALREALDKYATDLCEYGKYNEGCGKYDELTCGGCYARAALEASHGRVG